MKNLFGLRKQKQDVFAEIEERCAKKLVTKDDKDTLIILGNMLFKADNPNYIKVVELTNKVSDLLNQQQQNSLDTQPSVL